MFFVIMRIDMKLESNGILIGLRPFNERDAIARVFTRDFGVLVGMMRGANVAKKNRPLLGQVGAVSWNARLDSQLGTFHWDAEKNLGAAIMMNPGALMRLNAAFEILTTLLPERESYMDLYDETLNMIENLGVGAKNTYLIWEINLLRDLGYALDLSKCSGCGVVENLNFLSPRTGRAVCDKCAAPYINRLYKLPVNLDTTLRFLENICVQQGVDVPAVRRMIKNI
ncbi:MAG: DNA repair protein RecO [Alphaproteobacteria bacterium]|nr:DNA repair protein RecO [Alphaproteobacteria bacterium]